MLTNGIKKLKTKRGNQKVNLKTSNLTHTESHKLRIQARSRDVLKQMPSNHLIKQMASKSLKRTATDLKSMSRKNIFELNQIYLKEHMSKEPNCLDMISLSQDNRVLSTRQKSQTFRKMDFSERLTFETNLKKKYKLSSAFEKNKKCRIDFEKLERNLNKNKIFTQRNIREISKDRKDASRKMKSKSKARTNKCSTLITNKLTKKDSFGKVKLSTFLKTERNNFCKSRKATPRRVTKIDLRLISINKNKNTTGRQLPIPIKSLQNNKRSISKNKLEGRVSAKVRATKTSCREINNLKSKQNKQTFETLKLVPKSKKLSREETLLVLKSLESEKIMRQKPHTEFDLFF